MSKVTRNNIFFKEPIVKKHMKRKKKLKNLKSTHASIKMNKIYSTYMTQYLFVYFLRISARISKV